MRVTSELYVSQLVRRIFSAGGFAAVIRKGAAEAGAIFITVQERAGTVQLFRPAPQTAYETGRPQDRQFTRAAKVDNAIAAAETLEREARFDPDLWIVEIEPPNGDVAGFVDVTTP